MSKELIPNWAQTENLRWCNWGWDPLDYLRRLGGQKVTFFGNNHWMKQWWERIHTPETVRKMADLGINVAFTHFYKGAGLKFESDIREKLKELVKLCHENNIRVVGYVQLGSLFHESLKLEKPECEEWAVRKYDGSIECWNYYRWRQCLNQPGLIEYMKSVIKLGIEEIGLDGFHFDNSTPFPCYCERCRKGFREYLTKKIKSPERMWITDFSAIDPPPPAESSYIRDPLEQEWIRYCCQKGADNFGKLYKYIKNINPDLMVHGNNGFPRYEGWAREFALNPYLFGQNVDLFCAETVNFPCFEYGKLITQIDAFRYGESIGYQTLPASWLHDNETNKVILPTTGAQAKLFIAEPIISGGSPGFNFALRSTGGASLTIDNKNISDAIKEYNDFFEKYKSFYSSAQTVSRIGFFHSFDSFAMGGHEVYMACNGMVLTLIAANIPYKYVMEENMSNINDFALIILSNQMCLSDETCEKIIKFVKSGGKLYISGDSGKYDENFLERSENAFCSIINYPNVSFFADIPEAAVDGSDVDFECCDWLGTAIALPKKYNEVKKNIKNLLGDDDFIKVEAPASVVVTPRVLSDNTIVIHALNYDHKSIIKKVNIELDVGFSVDQYVHYLPDTNNCINVKNDSKSSVLQITFKELETYQFIVISSK